jgi:hypothetical protein
MRNNPVTRMRDRDQPARELLRLVLGDVVDELSNAAAGRVLAAMFAAAKREMLLAHRYDGQLDLLDTAA